MTATVAADIKTHLRKAAYASLQKGAFVAQQFFKIKNCFAFKCPRAWERLAATAHDTERHCASCDKLVFLCHDDEALTRHVQAGHCVAVEDVSNAGSTLIGQIASEYSPSAPEQEQVPEKLMGLKIAPGAFGTKVDLNGKINWD